MIINQTIHIELAPEGPKIIDGYWHEWVNGEWVNTGRKAEGEDGTDGYSVSLSKSEHTFNYDKNGNLKGILSDGTISVEVLNGATPLICDSLGVLAPTTDGTYRVTNISISPSTTLSYNVDRQNNIFRIIPTQIDAEEVMVTFTIVARTNGVNTTFTRQLKYQKSHDGADGTDGADGADGDSVVHIYKQYPTKPATPSSGVINPTGWSRNPDYILSIVSQTNWAVNGKWHQSEELTATGNSSTSRITFTTYKDAQTITLELWADGHATYDYVYAGKLDTAASTSNYYNRVRGGRIIITYDVPTAGIHYIDIFWRKGIATIVGSNRGYYAIISDVKVWRSATNVIGGVAQDWSEPQQFFIDSALEERIYCLSKTTTAPVISDSDAYINDYIPLPCSLSSYRGDFTTYRAYSIGQVVKYQLEYYEVVQTVVGTYTGNPTNGEYFEKIPGWTDNPTGANKELPYEFVAIRKKQSDGLWGPYVTSVWSNYGIGTNYIPMGWWNSDVTYSKTDLGIPLVKKADGTALGYSVYTLKVAASTPGSFILSEWDLVESADFIYMQQAYIERLQAEIVTADRIDALQITSKIVRTAAYGSRTEIEGNTIKIFNDISIFPNIVFGMKNGYAVMEYYDNDGVMLYDLGPEGISMVDVVEEAWIEVSNLLFLGIDYTTVLTTPAIKSKYKRPLLQSQVTYYKYQSQRIGNVVSDPDNDGRLFVSPSKAANKIPIGVYCLRQNAFQYNLFGQPYSIPTRQHPSNESYYTTSAYQIYFQPLYNSHPASPGLIDSSVYDAYWSEKLGLPPAEL